MSFTSPKAAMLSQFKTSLPPERQPSSMPALYLPTGVPALDRILPRRIGFPSGRLNIVTGPAGVGKSTMGLRLIANVQRMGGVGIYLDFEKKLDLEYAENLGVDVEEMIIEPEGLVDRHEELLKYKRAKDAERHKRSHALGDEAKKEAKKKAGVEEKEEKKKTEHCPPYLEGALEYQERVMMAAGDVPTVIIFDSINECPSFEEFTGGFRDEFYAPRASVYSNKIPILATVLAGRPVVTLYICQIRDIIPQKGKPGGKQKISGGNAVKHKATVALELFPREFIKSPDDDTDFIASRISATTIKNQLGVPWRRCEFDVRFGEGLDVAGSILDCGIEAGVIGRSGSSYLYKGERFGIGREAARQYIREQPEVADIFLTELRKTKWWDPTAAPEEVPAPPSGEEMPPAITTDVGGTKPAEIGNPKKRKKSKK